MRLLSKMQKNPRGYVLPHPSFGIFLYIAVFNFDFVTLGAFDTIMFCQRPSYPDSVASYNTRSDCTKWAYSTRNVQISSNMKYRNNELMFLWLGLRSALDLVFKWCSLCR